MTQWTAFEPHKPIPALTPSYIRRNVEMSAYTLDIASGLTVCLQMLEHDDIQNGYDKEHAAPVLNGYQRGCIMRLCIASLARLSDQACLAVQAWDETQL
jgi:hypothetical protein